MVLAAAANARKRSPAPDRRPQRVCRLRRHGKVDILCTSARFRSGAAAPAFCGLGASKRHTTSAPPRQSCARAERTVPPPWAVRTDARQCHQHLHGARAGALFRPISGAVTGGGGIIWEFMFNIYSFKGAGWSAVLVGALGVGFRPSRAYFEAAFRVCTLLSIVFICVFRRRRCEVRSELGKGAREGKYVCVCACFCDTTNTSTSKFMYNKVSRVHQERVHACKFVERGRSSSPTIHPCMSLCVYTSYSYQGSLAI